jgi:hypothetical protein
VGKHGDNSQNTIMEIESEEGIIDEDGFAVYSGDDGSDDFGIISFLLNKLIFSMSP